MGTLRRFDLPSLIDRYGLLHFVETGTGSGEGLDYATQNAFLDCHSCEIERDLAKKAQHKHLHDPTMCVWNLPSAQFLEDVLPTIPKGEPILFWLDAHFPGADYGIRSYGAGPEEQRLPLKAELDLIRQWRPLGHDVILVDDLRIWIDGPFAHGGLPANVRPFCPKQRDASFFGNMFGTTHDVNFLYAEEGYVTLFPKDLT